jgi:glycosyltransferase involved in cell wall biosynthesis
MEGWLNGFDFDLIHAHMAFPDGLAGAELAREARKPLLITVHGKDTANAQWSTVYRSQLCREAILKAFRFSSKIVAVSSYVKRSIMEIYPQIDPEKIVVIHGGVDPDMKPAKERRPSGMKTIVSVGGLIPLKGHHYTIEAMRKVVKIFSNCRLMIVGEGEDKVDLLSQVEKSGLQNFVHFLNILPHDQLLEIMSACDLFVLPSWAEGLGMVYLEAMALGVPVIGCRGQGIEDIVSHGETGFLTQPKDSEGLADLILMLLKDEALRLSVGQRGQEVVLKNYRWQNNAAKHVRLYQTLCVE